MSGAMSKKKVKTLAKAMAMLKECLPENQLPIVWLVMREEGSEVVKKMARNVDVFHIPEMLSARLRELLEDRNNVGVVIATARNRRVTVFVPNPNNPKVESRFVEFESVE